jgi:hypothetical protein
VSVVPPISNGGRAADRRPAGLDAVRGSAAPETADLVREAVLAVPGVAGLHGGTFGEAATYLPGRKVEGVRVRPGLTEVHIVLAWDVPVQPTADAVRAVVTVVTGTAVDVVVQDVAAPGEGIP